MHKTALLYDLDERQRPIGWHLEEVWNLRIYYPPTSTVCTRSIYSTHLCSCEIRIEDAGLAVLLPCLDFILHLRCSPVA